MFDGYVGIEVVVYVVNYLYIYLLICEKFFSDLEVVFKCFYKVIDDYFIRKV